MKTNKLFAGALALALGLSAVAPSFAAETTTTKVSDTANVNGKVDYTVVKRLEEKGNEVVKAYNALVEAEKDVEAKKAAYDKAVAERDAARAAYKKATDRIDAIDLEVADHLAQFNVNLEEYKTAGGLRPTETDFQAALKNKNGVLSEADSAFINVAADKDKIEAQISAGNKALEELRAINALKAESDKLTKSLVDLASKVEELETVAANAAVELGKAERAEEAAEKAYKTALDEFVEDAKARNTVNEYFRRGDVTVIQTIVKEVSKKPVVTEETVETVTEKVINEIAGNVTEKEDKKEVSEAQIKTLEEAIFNNKVQAKAAEILLQKNPKAVANFKADLEKLLAESKATVEKATKLLDSLQKKTSFLDALVLTSYASEETTSEDVDALIKDLNSNTESISNLLEEAEKEAEKPAEKEEVKEEVKEEDKKEEVKEDKKEEVKTATTTTKAASTNAKTGVVGVAGVGAVLAAASAAYFASKRK